MLHKHSSRNKQRQTPLANLRVIENESKKGFQSGPKKAKARIRLSWSWSVWRFRRSEFYQSGSWHQLNAEVWPPATAISTSTSTFRPAGLLPFPCKDWFWWCLLHCLDEGKACIRTFKIVLKNVYLEWIIHSNDPDYLHQAQRDSILFFYYRWPHLSVNLAMWRNSTICTWTPFLTLGLGTINQTPWQSSIAKRRGSMIPSTPSRKRSECGRKSSMTEK